jgi:zinc/manganese transport system substrate-binding protein
MKAKRIAAALVLLVIIGVAAVFIVGGNRSGTSKNGLQVVAAENFWGNIASQLGGTHVHVTSIITDPGADPHQYESNAGNAGAVSSANVVIVNGEGYDDFMSKLLGGSKNSNRVVLNAQQILGAADGANPHLWYNIPRVSEVASKIADSYIAKDPSHKADYQHNLAVFDQSLLPLLATINQIKQQYSGAPVAYTEPVPGYLLSAADLSVKTPEGFSKSIEDGDDPSPADTQAMDDLMTNKAIKVLLYNSQATSPVTEHVKDLAKQAGIPVIGVTETLPANEKTYQSWQANQLKQLENALAEAQ